MRTPTGWARANILYDTMKAPPRFGSFLESVLIIVWKARQGLLVAGVRAQAQAALGGDAALEAFKEFKEQVHRVESTAKQNEMADVMKKWKDTPAIRFQPLESIGKIHGPKRRIVEGESRKRLLTPLLDYRPKKK